MKTLLYTSIYANLWETKFGGRAGRAIHYRYSLLTLLNLNPNKFICFTSPEEVHDLETWFYVQNNVSRNLLEFIVFDLNNSKYHEKIQEIKKNMSVVTADRCYEVQYNKFFWIDLLPNLNEYDRVFWIDAGLSHGGIFPPKYAYGNGYDRHFNFSLFNQDLLNKFIKLSESKIILLSKNNVGSFFWSQTIPSKYYENYSASEHIVGGLFGGTVENLLKFKEYFEDLLHNLLSTELELYFEEHVMSCIYKNNRSLFSPQKFDDWYDRNLPTVYGSEVKYFYEIFETENIPRVCVCSIAIELSDGARYLNAAKKLILSNLKYTKYDVLLITNKPEFFSDINNSKFILITYDKNFDETIHSDNRFNMHLKRLPIELASDMKYNYIFYNDCDCFIDGWDELSFNKKCEENFDVAFVSHASPQLGGLRKNYPHFQNKIDTEFVGLWYDELDNAPNPAETRVIFKNNEKLKNFIHFWNLIAKQNKNYFTYHDGVYFGTSAIYAKMNMVGITRNDEFTKYCKITHGGDTLDFFGTKIMKEEPKHVPGTFVYKGLQVLQHKNVVDVLKKLLTELNPKTIVEIGTENGGLTLLLQDLIVELGLSTKLRTYDIKEIKPLLSHPNLLQSTEIVNKNLFVGNPFVLSDEGKNEIRNFISSEGTNLILCDGARKSQEFNTLSEVINSGDVIMLHDYIIDDIEFETNFKNKIWNWHESKYSEIENSVKTNNLEPYLEKEFSEVVWGCFKKKYK